MLTHQILTHLSDAVLAAPPTPTAPPPPTGNVLNTNGVVGWIASFVVPILLAILGVCVIMWARGGQVSRTVTSTGIAFVGVALIGGAGVLMKFGDDIVNLIFQ